jgi:hypothetical protein
MTILPLVLKAIDHDCGMEKKQIDHNSISVYFIMLEVMKNTGLL